MLLCAGLPVHHARAADIFEPWEKGFSDAELFVGVGEKGHSAGMLLTGFGFGSGGSLAVSFSMGEKTEGRFGLFLAGTWLVGGHADLSVWGESGVTTGTLDAELAHADWTAGTQLVCWRDGAVPYGVLSVFGEEGDQTRVHPLIGLMVPSGRVEVHVELSSEQPDGENWPVHLAVGPNVHLKPWLEVLPEVSVIHEGDGTTSWAVTVGLIVNPQHWTGPHR